MSLLAPAPIGSHWDRDRQRPFWRLVELFAARIFRGGGDADAEGIDLGIGLVLTLLAMPGGFVSLLLLDKYGSFLQWLRGMTNVDPLAVSFPDEYFFIVLSMTVTGAVAVWRWDAIFPDRRDYINLVPLPISTRTIFLANLVAVLFLVGLIAVDVNAASCVLFPMVVAAMQTKFLFFVKFAIVHATIVVLSSVFSFFAVFSLLGVLMAVLPVTILKRVSTYVRGLIVIYLVTLLSTSFAVPYNLWRASDRIPGWAFLFPSSWFLSLCQVLRGRATPALIQLSHLAVPAIAASVALALATYAVGYQRHFIRIPEMADTGLAAQNFRESKMAPRVQRLALRTPFLRGCFRFVWRTLVRSEMHRLVVTAAAGFGLVLASQAAMNAVQNSKTLRQAAMSPDAISIPYILTFLLIIGLRVVFEIPTDLRSNWIFQLLLNRDRQECASLARSVILSVVLPLVFLIFPFYAYLEGFGIACLHTSIVAIWAVLLTNIVLVRFRKLPFTCTLPLFKQHSIVILLAFCFGYLIYAVSTPEFESYALSQPERLLSMAPVIVIAWLVPRYLSGNTPEIERRLIFEESAGRNFELLRLGE
jgi:hypothetical protein